VLSFADLDGEGDLDVLAQSPQRLMVLTNNGNGLRTISQSGEGRQHGDPMTKHITVNARCCQ
jgi:hypothetical protein